MKGGGKSGETAADDDDIIALAMLDDRKGPGHIVAAGRERHRVVLKAQPLVAQPMRDVEDLRQIAAAQHARIEADRIAANVAAPRRLGERAQGKRAADRDAAGCDEQSLEEVTTGDGVAGGSAFALAIASWRALFGGSGQSVRRGVSTMRARPRRFLETATRPL